VSTTVNGKKQQGMLSSLLLHGVDAASAREPIIIMMMMMSETHERQNAKKLELIQSQRHSLSCHNTNEKSIMQHRYASFTCFGGGEAKLIDEWNESEGRESCQTLEMRVMKQESSAYWIYQS
jgi:hypothetical protein